MRRTTGLVTLLLAAATCVRAHELADSGPATVIESLKTAWNAHDAAPYLALWSFASADAETAERAFAQGRFDPESGNSRLALYAPPPVAPMVKRVTTYGEIVTIKEPWGKVDQVVVRLEKQNDRWAVVSRQMLEHLEGLAHLSLDPNGFVAKGHTLRLPDFELTMDSGTLFTAPDALGRTVWVFAGDGRVRFRPEPAAERDQLRRFCGRTELEEPVKLAFLRTNPVDSPAIITGPPLVPDSSAIARWPAAFHYFSEHVEDAYLMDTALPGAPWWLIPAAGDSALVFESSRGPLTLSINRTAAEGVAFFDRPRQRQICLYPLPGKPRDFDDSGERRFDVLHTDVRVTLDPDSDRLIGEARLRLATLSTAGTIQLRLNEALTVDSISSDDGRRYLSFRMRQQKTLVVAVRSLGAGHETTLNIRYHGVLRPPPFEREPSGHEEPVEFEKALRIVPPIVYAQNSAWYPQAENDDFQTASIEVDLPAGYTVVGPGKRTTPPAPPGRSVARLAVEKPVKQLVFAVARLVEGGQKRESGVVLSAFTVPRLKAEAEESLEMAARIVRLFTQQFGPCPYGEISVLLFEAAKPGGHSPPGLVLLGRRPVLLGPIASNDPANFSDQPGFFLAHEIAHQWWGDGVAPASYHDRWISEAVAHYAAALWIEQSRGDEAFRGVMREMERWGIEKNGAGPISLGHRVGHLDGDPQLYRAVVYDKGAAVLHMIRRILGDDPFRRGLTEFQQRYRFQKAGTPEMQKTLEEASAIDLAPYFEAWIYGTTLPSLSLASRTQNLGGTYRTAIDVKPVHLPGSVPVGVTMEGDGGARETRVLPLPAAGAHWDVDTSFPPRRVRLNDDAGLLARVEN